MKVAMKREKRKNQVIGTETPKAAIQYKEIEIQRELNDEVLELAEIKQRQEAIPDYQRANREEAVNKLKEEIECLQTYLPQQMTEEEIRNLTIQVIKENQAQGPKDIGKVMKSIMPRIKGRADGKLVNIIVKQTLESN